jgi:hypothetical protein
MIKKNHVGILTVIVLFCMSFSYVYAYTEWESEYNLVSLSWFDDANWKTGSVPPASDKAGIKSEPGPEILSGDNVLVNQITLGGASGGTITLRGGTLTTTSYIIMGTSFGEDGTFIIDEGSIDCQNNLYVGRAGSGYIELNMGTIDVSSTFGIAEQVNSEGEVVLNNGSITCNDFRMANLGSATAAMDLSLGRLVVEGDEAAEIQGYIDSGWITGFGGNSAVAVDYNESALGKTTVMAVHPLNPYPANGDSVNYNNFNLLTWELPEPSTPGASVTCDVYLDTDPVNPPKVLTNTTDESYSVSVVPTQDYYWRIVVFEDGSEVLDSQLLTFNTNNTPPYANAGGDITSWLEEGSTVVDLNVNVTDDGLPGPYSVQWSLESQPEGSSAVFAPASADQESLTLTVDTVGEYVLTVVADDSEYTHEDTLSVFIYENACEAAKSLDSFTALNGDANLDCTVDMADIALIASDWLDTNQLTNQNAN